VASTLFAGLRQRTKTSRFANGALLCLDRWGPPSDAELRNGMPFHGEAARVEWKQIGAAEHLAGRIVVTMEATLPLAGLDVRRTVGLSESQRLSVSPRP